MRKYLSVEATKTLVHTAILSRIDYANALMYGIPEAQLDRLQGLQTNAARLIILDGCHVDSKVALRKLH